MIVALYAVAVAMVLGGGAAGFYGYGIIMVERGWTLVIAGSVVASGGALLVGIAHLTDRMARVQRNTDALRERFGRLDPATLPPAVKGSGLAPAPRGPLDLETPTELAADMSEREPAAAAAAKAPSAERARPTRQKSAAPILSDVPLRGTTAAALPDASPAPEDTAPDSSKRTATPTVVGTYDSGGNHYVMFSDGSIEAETPNGVFRFASLDELKDFIASGGEGVAAPA